MVSFENTEIAFKHKTTKELKKAYFLFNSIARPWLVKTGKVFLNLALKLRIPISWAVKPTIYEHFVGGVTIDDCLPTAKKLDQYNVKSILDYSVEGGESEKEIEEALRETLASIENASRHPEIPFAVFKPTAFGKAEILEKASSGKKLNDDEQKEADKFRDRIHTLCKRAYELDIPILIDAEDSFFQNKIDEVVTAMMELFNKKRAIVFNTLQMYRWDRLQYLKDSYEKAEKGGYYYGVKFVRGAYMEKERERAHKKGYKDPIQPDKESTDRDYNAALKFTVEHIDRCELFNGTHNEESSLYKTKLKKEHKLKKNDPRIYFSQLYGMSDHISFNLASEGYNVAKYVPYGPVKHVMPYLIRRAEENTSVKGQTGRELSLIKKERERRKKES